MHMEVKVKRGESNAIDDTNIFSVVPIGGAIVRPRLWRLQPTEGNSRESPQRAIPTKGPRSSNLVYSMMAYVHEGLALLGVDLHEVGDLLALTNSWFNSTITKKEAPKRFLTNLGGTTLQKVIDVVV